MKADDTTQDCTRSEPIVIDVDAVYPLDAASHATSISTKALASAINTGELKATQRARRYFISGADLKEWLTSGDVASISKGHTKAKGRPEKAKTKKR